MSLIDSTGGHRSDSNNIGGRSYTFSRLAAGNYRVLPTSNAGATTLPRLVEDVWFFECGGGC